MNFRFSAVGWLIELSSAHSVGQALQMCDKESKPSTLEWLRETDRRKAHLLEDIKNIEEGLISTKGRLEVAAKCSYIRLYLKGTFFFF